LRPLHSFPTRRSSDLDGIHRWFGSIATNAAGDMALGFSASNSTNPSVFPSVYYTGRHAGYPPGQMTLGEGVIINGTGSQTGTARSEEHTSELQSRENL